jgi:hypothetical protein
MDALVVFLIYVVPFLALGLAGSWWMRRKGVDLEEVQAQAGKNRRRRRLFFLGFWRWEE